MLQLSIEAVERGLLPDALVRVAIRRLCSQRLRELQCDGTAATHASQTRFIESMRSAAIAPAPQRANEQHYEIPEQFFGEVLGSRRKYSCCYWPDESTTLDEAEQAALEISCERAQIADGQDILELGCGWGSLCLWIAERYPRSRVTAISNSALQRRFIAALAIARGLRNLRLITADIGGFAPPRADSSDGRFDRIVSVEMFEHLRNYERLLNRVASWLRPEGKLFVHIFCHRELVYPFETDGAANWMGRHFFTGGIMPSADLLRRFDRDLTVSRHWTWNGRHYQRTAEAWLANLKAHRDELLPILSSAYEAASADRWFHRWRIFFLAVSELFGFSSGEDWFVSHYLLEHVR